MGRPVRTWSKMKPFLSICIPTYNRAYYLRMTLESIVEEISSVPYHIEVVVSDNGSTDNTLEVLEDFSKKYSFFKYFKNSTNLGFDVNFISAIEHSSQGGYIWTFSDDDLIKKGALKEIINLINIYNPNYVCVNYDQFTTMNGKIKNVRLGKEFRKFNRLIKDVRFNLNFREILDLILVYPGFLSINIYRKECLNVNEILEHVTNVKSWSHFWMIAQATLDGGGVISPNIAVSQRTGNSSVNSSVFFKQLPNTFSYIFALYEIDQKFANIFFNKLSKNLFSITSIIYTVVYLKLKREKLDSIEISQEIRKPCRIVLLRILFYITPRFLVIVLTKFVRFLKGK